VSDGLEEKEAKSALEVFGLNCAQVKTEEAEADAHQPYGPDPQFDPVYSRWAETAS